MLAITRCSGDCDVDGRVVLDVRVVWEVRLDLDGDSVGGLVGNERQIHGGVAEESLCSHPW